MPRHSKLVSVMDGKKPHRSNKEIEKRKKNEQALNVGNDDIKPPTWLNSKAKKVFERTTEYLKQVNVITNLDIDTLAVYCDSVAKYEEENKALKKLIKDYKKFERECKDPMTLMEKSVEVNKLIDKLQKGQLRLADNIRKYAIEFGLTPQARAKLSIHRDEEEKEVTEEERMFGGL